MEKFRCWINAKRKLDLKNYEGLHAWSSNRRTAEGFWIDLFEYEGLKPGATPARAYDRKVGSPGN